MTEDQIEIIVERKTDALDSALMAGRITQSEYDSRMKELSQWADRQYEAMKR